MLAFEEIHPQFASIGNGSAKHGLYSSLLPIFRDPWVEWAVSPFDLLEAESVEARVGKESHEFALRSVRRGHHEFLTIHQRELAIGLGRCHLSATSADPFTERPQRPVGEPLEHGRTVVGAIMVAEAANNRIGLLNLQSDRESMVAEEG